MLEIYNHVVHGSDFCALSVAAIICTAASVVAINIFCLMKLASEAAYGLQWFIALLRSSIGCPRNLEAKARGSRRFSKRAMRAIANERQTIEVDLEHAVAKRQFSLVYQPQRTLNDGEVVGFEALLRWNHPERGEISPSLFVPIAEENGIILQIGEWVLRAACLTAATWKKPLTIAVNVSTVQLGSQTFANDVQTILLASGLPPSRLELEITETALIHDRDKALQTIQNIRALGVKIAMDDFGTGYSSLSNLHSFPVDKIKIDRSFVSSIDKNKQSATIVRAIIDLGKALGMPVLAEGIETREEMEFLSVEACPIGQGYYLGQPDRIEQFGTETGAAAILSP